MASQIGVTIPVMICRILHPQVNICTNGGLLPTEPWEQNVIQIWITLPASFRVATIYFKNVGYKVAAILFQPASICGDTWTTVGVKLDLPWLLETIALLLNCTNIFYTQQTTVSVALIIKPRKIN